MLCVCLDSFKFEYLAYTTYLKSLAERHLHGRLEPVLGFPANTASFLTGCYPDKHHVFGIFQYCSESSLGWSRFIASLSWQLADSMVSLSRILQRKQFLFKLPRVAPARLSYFGPFMDEHWTAPNVLPVRTLYDLLRYRGCSFISIDWPNISSTDGQQQLFLDRSNASVLRQAKRHLDNYDFVYVHFLELDHVAHEFGVHSPQVRRAVQELDACLAQLDCEQMVVFSDHGMVDVKSTVDVANELEQLGLRFGEDLVYFLDSTCARVWFIDESKIDLVVDKLESLEFGHLLSKEEMAHYRLPPDVCDILFLADPGYLISPNFFQGGDSVRAMHGYDPACCDQQGFYLMKNLREQKDAKMVDMLSTLLQLMGLPLVDCDGTSLA